MRWKSMLVPAALSLLSACGDSEGIVDVPIVTQVIVTPAEADLFVTQRLQLQVRPEDEDGHWVEQAECTWSSADRMVVAVGSWGLASGVAPGSVAVTATCDGVKGSAQLTVDALILDDSMILELSGTGSAVLYDVGGSSPTDVFAVGATGTWECCGTIMHYDGVHWSEMPAPDVPGALLGVWANSASDVFTVGEAGTILHYDGTAWVAMEGETTADLAGVWGSSPSDVFAVGAGGTVLHYDGQSWSPMSVPSGGASLAGIWGSSGTDVFTVGDHGAILHYDGASWVQMLGGASSLHRVWGSSATDVFAVGEVGTVLHYDGTSWKRVTVPITHYLSGIWGTADQQVFVVGGQFVGGVRNWYWAEGPVVLHYDGEGWGVTEPTVAAALLGAWGTSEDVFLVGSGPMVLRVKR
jgi:hypothetical protein